jgi:hypothetical protein
VEEVEKIVEVPLEEVSKEEAECQTDIGMEYFDRNQHPLQKTDSKSSGNSNKQRVGGGGAIAKPPKPVSKSNSTKLGDPINITGYSNPSQPS